MKKSKGAVIGVCVLVSVAAAVFFSSLYEKNRARRDFAERIYSQGSESAPDSVEEIKSAIAVYENRIEQHVQDAVKLGTYWKILAVRLQDGRSHGEALEALQHAIYYAPEDPALHYYTGVSAGSMAKSTHTFPGMGGDGKDSYFTLAEQAYLRAIELDDRYLRPRYGLAVLYVFELERPEDAIPHLERSLEISRNDVDTMFVLARARYMLREYQAAVDLYDRIITLSADEQKRIDAQNNRQIILGQMYG